MNETTGMNVLIVDDCQADTKLLQLWLRDSQSISSLSQVSAGRAALRYVRGQEEYQSRVCPDLVLLDSNLPDMHGLDVLEELKRDPAYAQVGILVLSGTFHESDARRARELGAVEYRIKPFEASEFEDFVRRLDEFWASRSNSGGPGRPNQTSS